MKSTASENVFIKGFFCVAFVCLVGLAPVYVYAGGVIVVENRSINDVYIEGHNEPILPGTDSWGQTFFSSRFTVCVGPCDEPTHKRVVLTDTSQSCDVKVKASKYTSWKRGVSGYIWSANGHPSCICAAKDRQVHIILRVDNGYKGVVKADLTRVSPFPYEIDDLLLDELKFDLIAGQSSE